MIARGLVCASWLVASLGVARAEDVATERARIHLKAAIADYDEGRYAEAATEMEQAYTLRPLPDLQYNLAQCYERLNRQEEAAGAYEKYLAGRPDAPDRKLIEERIKNARARAQAIAAGQAPPPEVREKVVWRTMVVYREAPPPPGRAARWAAYGLGVLGLGSLATGIAFAVMASQAAATVTRGGSLDMPPTFDGKVRDTQENGKIYPIVSGVTFGVGGLAVAGAVALYLVSKRIDREAPKVAVTPLLGPSRAALALTGRF
jgi:tetratricopeptide (TPR) repeat protein